MTGLPGGAAGQVFAPEFPAAAGTVLLVMFMVRNELGDTFLCRAISTNSIAIAPKAWALHNDGIGWFLPAFCPLAILYALGHQLALP